MTCYKKYKSFVEKYGQMDHNLSKENEKLWNIKFSFLSPECQNKF